MGIDFSENSLVHKPAIKLFHQLGWETADCFHEFDTPEGSPLGRATKSEVIIISHLKTALEKLNPELPDVALEQAIEELTRDRSRMSLVAANQEIYNLLKNGIKVQIPDDENGGETTETVKIIYWNQPDNNDFFLTSEFWVTGEMYTRRADLVGFVNGIPLLFIELKASHRRLEVAYKDNLRDYKNTIPQLFWYNAFIILSNGSESKIGSVTAPWEHFNDWKKISDEEEPGVVSLETMIRGTCQHKRFLDIAENFTLFMKARGGIIKILAKNHQYLGVNNAIEALQNMEVKRGRLGVFWHTQGSGKSISMAFFSNKVLRKYTGNWTFVVVTDRVELDGQIYKNFADAGVVTEKRARATSSRNLRKLLREDHRFVFTLIHKFRTDPGELHPVLSERSDVIVITDEAHRSQYDTLAFNMRTALPNASFIAFTGTPLIVGEEKTKEVFGDYVSTYNFKQSVDDKATVPLYYEDRKPHLQLKNKDFNEDIYRVIEEAELDEYQQQKLDRTLSRQYHLITRDNRLEIVAKDIVKHFTSRGYKGKGMVVCIDKATAVRMYDKVTKHWKKQLKKLRESLRNTTDSSELEIIGNVQKSRHLLIDK
ncbi:type I restriction endonuclease subunit R [bacterium]|nr:type I restriction endonuclease subunit R [bacterium]